MKISTSALGVLMLAASFAAPVAAQTRPSIGVYGLFDRTTIASSQTFDAVFNTHTTSGPGGGVDAINLWRGLFMRFDASTSELTGERVVVFNGDVFKVGIPLTAKLTPIEFGGGWRLEPRQSTKLSSRLAPYAGVSVVILKYRETSSFADASENADESYTGVGVFGGVDVRLVRQAFAGVEAQYRSITSAPGPDSVAASFSEKNLGGAVLRLRVGIRF